MNKRSIKEIGKKVISVILAITCITNLCLSVTSYSVATNAYGTLGTNKALGSPILNNNMTSDKWNKYETLTWGIFLSNFCVPFVDDFESAFNLNSSKGSNGSGTKALCFATGSDISNSKVIKDLTTYAINNQDTGLQQIYVSYNTLENGKLVSENVYSAGSVNTDPNDPNYNANANNTSTVEREATVLDLFLQSTDSGDAGMSWVDSDFSSSNKLSTVNYPDMYVADNANLPTFAVKGSANSNKKQIVFDYRETYDIEMFVGALSKALTSDQKEIAAELLGQDLATLGLYLDAYGNICTNYDSRTIVIIPASANQHLTTEKSINFVNSLIFNCGSYATNNSTLVNMAGQDDAKATNWFGFTSAGDQISGQMAFTYDGSGISDGGMVIFYDTDSIVASDSDNTQWSITVSTPNTTIVSKDIDTGAILKKLYNAELTDPATKIPFKIEPVNTGEKLFKPLNGKGSTEYSGQNIEELTEFMMNASSCLVNTLPNDSGKTKKLTHIVDYNNGDEIPLFEKALVVPVQAVQGSKSNGEKTDWAIYRNFVNYTYQTYKSKDANDANKRIAINKAFESGDTREKFFNLLVTSNSKASSSSKLSELAIDFIMSSPNFYTVNDANKLKDITLKNFNQVVSGRDGAADILRLDPKEISDKSAATPLVTVEGTKFGHGAANSKISDKIMGRQCKIFYTSDVLSAVSNALGLRSGTDFSVYSTFIYLTYLDWYDLEIDKLTGKAKSNFNTDIFNPDGLIEKLDDITDVPSEEEMQQEVLRYTYLMLHPTEGKAYRSEILMSNMASWIYEQYQKVVYGSVSNYNYNNVATTNNTGFLAVENYSDNFMTSWFMGNYPTMALYLIAFGIIFSIIIYILKRRKTSWLLTAMAMVVTVILVLPSTGEIVPLIANNVVQDIFEDKMTYWSISEQATNASYEQDTINQVAVGTNLTANMTQDEQAKVYSLVQNIKSIYLDRYISVKQDIANKVVGTGYANGYDDIQTMKSTRWLLPMVIRQWTADDNSANYVYVTLGDKLEDMSNLYWYYKPTDAQFAKTINSQDLDGDAKKYGDDEAFTAMGTSIQNRLNLTKKLDTSSGRAQVYGGFKETNISSLVDTGYRSISYSRNSDNLPHLYSYLIDHKGLVNNTMSISSIPYSNYNNFDKWAEAYLNQIKGSSNMSNIVTVANTLNSINFWYNRYDRSTVLQPYGYLWATESPMHYFYQVVKDSFREDSTLLSTVIEIQGKYLDRADGNGEYRSNFMVDDNTYQTRDILDLENMFNNMIPYMYTMQLWADGTNGKNGAFDPSKPEGVINYSIQTSELKASNPYNGNDMSWLFRCNWVTKMMESKDYNSPARIRLSDGTTVTVANQMMPSCYTAAGRNMVFSAAQRDAMGLQDKDLSLVELKCIKVNEDIYKDWTLMLNYINTSGMTKEVLMRQMAVDATMIFNKNFSANGLTNQAYMMYPASLDLRSISFDSIMCMLMLNVTHNSSYIYGDTMQVLIENSDMFTAAMLLIIAALCVWVIPWIRAFTLGLMFYLGFVAMLRTLLADSSAKAKTSIGFLGCNVLYLIAIVLYLFGFKLLMQMTTSDQIISISSPEMNTGNPMWCMFVVLILSGLFIYVSCKMVDFCIRNYRDMGFEVMKGTVEMVSSSVSAGFEGLMGKVAELAETGEVSSGKSSKSSKSKGSGSKSSKSGSGSGSGSSGKSKSSSSGSDSGSGDSKSSKSGDSSNNKKNNPDYSDGGKENYQYKNGASPDSDNDSSAIDSKIEKGKQKVKEQASEKQKNNVKPDRQQNSTKTTKSKKTSA